MKRKTFSILLVLVLVLSFGLVTAVPVAAVEIEPPPPDAVVFPFELGAKNDEGATAEWSSADKYAGSSSVHLVTGPIDTPPDWGDGDEARILIDFSIFPEGQELTLGDIETISWWVSTKLGYSPHLDITMDVDGDEIVDPEDMLTAELAGNNTNYTHPPVPGADEWRQTFEMTTDDGFAQIDGTTTFWVTKMGAGTYDAPFGTLDEWRTTGGQQGTGPDTGDVIPIYTDDTPVVKLEIEVDNWIVQSEAYVDDITINGTLIAGQIQDAIDSVGDILIMVLPGTYHENVVIDKAVELIGVDLPVIDGEGTLINPAIHVQVASVTVEGFIIEDFIATGADMAGDIGAILVEGDNTEILNNIIRNITCTETAGVSPAGLGIDISASNVDVIGNEVHDISSIGIRVRAFATAKTVILLEDNTVYNTGNSGVLVVGDVDNVTIKDNEIYDSLEPTPYSLLVIPVFGQSPDIILIEGNTIYNGYGNICLGSVTNVTITDNTIYDAIPHYSDPANIKGKNIYIRDWTEAATNNVTITGNSITGADGYGVYIMGTYVDVSTISITFNNITGNTVGVENTTNPDGVNACQNWWGDISGPTVEGEGQYYSGAGDSVIGQVGFEPWLTRPFETVIADEIAYQGFPMVWFNTGWNTFSTPVALDAGCDEWDEYVALGDGLNIHATSPAYAFDGAIQDWLPLIGEDADYELKPCDAIYVRMAAPDIGAILYSPDVSVPSKDLYDGWNLVGLGWLPDGPVDGMSVPDVLDTVYTVTGDLTGYSLVVNPPINGEQWFFVRDSEQEGPPLGEWLKDYLQETLQEWSQSGSGLPFEVWLISEYGPIIDFFLSDMYGYLMDDCEVWGLSHGIDNMAIFMEEICYGLVQDAIYELMDYLMENWDPQPLDECLNEYIMAGRMHATRGYWVFMINPGTLAGFTMTPMPFGMPEPEPPQPQ